MNMKYLLISLILLPLTGTAQTYTLEECCRLALEQNAKIKTATNDRSVAVMEKKEAFTNFLPSVSLMSGAMKADDAMLQMAMGDQTMKLMDGGMYGSVMASLPIYAGGKILNGHKLAELGVEISELQLHQTQNEVKLTVAKYYWQIVVLTEKLRTLESVRELLDNMNRDVNHAVEAGIRKRNDLLQVQLRKNDTQSAFIDVEKNLEVCKMLLAQYMGVESDKVEVAISLDTAPVSPDALFVNHTDVLETTPEYRLLQKNVDAARLQKRMALGEYLPTVSVSGGYMYQDFMGPSQNSFIGMVSVSVPISWKAPYSVKKQKYRYRNAVTKLNDGGEQLIIRMQKTQNDLQSAYQQVLIAQKSIDQAAENLRLNENYYKAGTSSMSDLLDAQTLFRQSKDKYAEVYADYEIKKTEYLQITGR